MYLNHKTSRALSVIFFCVAAVFFYMYLNCTKQDEKHARMKHISDTTHVLDRAVHPSDVRTVSDRNTTDAVTGRIDAKDEIDLNMDAAELLNRTAIVTAASQNHFAEVKGMIGSVQEIMPHKKIILYDLGLSPRGVAEIKRLCNVEVRSFDFSKYPPHVKHLFKYAWKPLIIRDSLKEFEIVFWGDASARLQKDLSVLFPVLKQQQGFAAFVEQYGSTKMLARTNPKMFKELQIDMKKFAQDDGYPMCMEGNRLLFANTSVVQKEIIKPWVDCALREECIAPAGSVLGVHQLKPEKHTHRFDQAALALIVYKNLRGLLNKDNDQSKLFFSVAKVDRSPRGHEKAKYCTN